jgi:hypothetical protein
MNGVGRDYYFSPGKMETGSEITGIFSEDIQTGVKAKVEQFS